MKRELFFLYTRARVLCASLACGTMPLCPLRVRDCSVEEETALMSADDAARKLRAHATEYSERLGNKPFSAVEFARRR